MNTKRKILIVDDYAPILYILTNFLHNEFAITQVTDGFNAIELIQREHFDLAILDLQLAEMSGKDILKICLKHEIPTIFLSGETNSKEKIEILEMGALDFVTKPFHPREIELRIQNIFKRVAI